MKRPPAIHPFLFGLAPILLLFTYNSRRFSINPDELLLPVALTLVATLAIWLLLSVICWNRAKGGIITSLLVLLFFSFGHVAGAVRVSTGLLLVVSALLLLTAVPVFLARRSFATLTTVLNVISLAVIVVTVMNGLSSVLRARSEERGARAPTTRDSKLGTPDSASNYPDIYYIILDTYARADVLESDYHHDNSEFIGFLKKNGFFIADSSLSNYAQTYLSLASSLNFTYLDSIAAREGPASLEQTPLIRMIEYSRLAEFLKGRGYTIVSYASGYTGTDLKDADIHLEPRWALSEFQDLLLTTTVLPALLGSRVGALQDESHRQRVLYTLRTIPHATRGKHPVFVFAHIICPHTPFVFDSLGRRPDVIPYLRINQTGTTRQVTRRLLRDWYFENYGPQVAYLNKLLEEVVQRILAQSPNPPIIIFQGDHGPGQIASPDELSPREMLKRHAIMNAIHLPETVYRLPPTANRPDSGAGSGERSADSVFYDSISPVNTFRVLLSSYLDTAMKLLPDRSYYSTLVAPYRFTAVSPTP